MFHIVIKETKEFLRDRTNLFFFILFPVILIFLLGNLLSSLDQAEDAIGEIKMMYQLDTDNDFQRMAVQNFISSAGESNQLLKFEETQDLEAAKKLAGDDKVAAVVKFTGDPMKIQIYEGRNQIKNKAIGAIFSSFVQTNKAISTVFTRNAQVLTELNATEEEYVEQKDLGIKRTMIDYYAVSMLAMICFMSLMVGAGAFLGERQNKTINRLIVAPQNRLHLFLQKILGMVPQVVLQIVVIMIVSITIFKANYGATIADNLYLFLMFFVVTLCMISIGAAIGIVIKTNPMAVLMPVLWIMMFFGGTYSKEMRINGFTEAMPIYQIQQAAYDLAIFGHYTKANYVILNCMGIMLIALIIGAFLFGRMEESR